MSQSARNLLLTFGLFRRSELSFESIRQCVMTMPRGGSAVESIHAELDRRGGRYPALDALVAHSLVERLDGGGRDLIQLRLHEVIYDFVQKQWSLAADDAPLRELELALTKGAVTFASQQINAESIHFLDIETLTGFLIPIVRPERNIRPSKDRVTETLSFWFDHFKFQNFVYDTGLQELLLGQLENLADYVATLGLDDRRYDLVLKKLIGHAHYADPLGSGGARAGAYFNEAIQIAREIEGDPRYVHQLPQIKWYKVFLLNHRSNLASKLRPQAEQALEVWSDSALAADLCEIEATLPETLKSLEAQPALMDCELLVRASIYWGHRGNQDNFILYRRVEGGDRRDRFDAIVEDARRFYALAAAYRLHALRLFRWHLFEQRVAKAARAGVIPFTPDWLLDVKSESSEGFEAFTSFSQGIGDTAHQYRGRHFVDTVAYVAEPDAARRTIIFADAEISLRAAQALWEVSDTSLASGEVMLKYQLWMASSLVFDQMMQAIEAGRSVPPLAELLDLVRDEVNEMQKRAKSNYAFGVEQQKFQLGGVHAAALRQFG